MRDVCATLFMKFKRSRRYLQARVGFFCNLRPTATQYLATQVTLQTFPAGAVICHQDSDMDAAWMLISGSAHVFRKRDRRGHSRAGSRFGGASHRSDTGGLLYDAVSHFSQKYCSSFSRERRAPHFTSHSNDRTKKNYCTKKKHVLRTRTFCRRDVREGPYYQVTL